MIRETEAKADSTFFFCLRHALQPRLEGTPGIVRAYAWLSQVDPLLHIESPY